MALEESTTITPVLSSASNIVKEATNPINITDAIEEPSAGNVTYRMTGKDTQQSNKRVFWNSFSVDSNASDYTGTSGPVIDIKVFRVVGSD